MTKRKRGRPRTVFGKKHVVDNRKRKTARRESTSLSLIVLNSLIAVKAKSCLCCKCIAHKNDEVQEEDDKDKQDEEEQEHVQHHHHHHQELATTNTSMILDSGLRSALSQVRDRNTQPDDLLHTGSTAAEFAHVYIISTQRPPRKPKKKKKKSINT